MGPADIEKLMSVGRPDLAPDGSFAVFATSRPDLTANRAVGQLWRVDLPDGQARRLTRGTADRSPQLSPDGARIAFLRGDDRGKAQLHVVDARGGEPVQVTAAPLGVDAFDWSGDGATLAFSARVPEHGRYGSVDGLESSAEAPRRITGVRWHSNGLGYLADRPAQLFVVPVPAVDAEPFYEPAPAALPDGADKPEKKVIPAEPVQLTHGAASRTGAVFRDDEVLTVLDEIESDHRDLRSRLIAVRADGSGERELIDRTAALSISEVAVAEDGMIAVLAADVGESGTDFVAAATSLWLLEPDGPRRLTDPETIDLGEVGSVISPVGEDFLVQDRTRGRVRLLRVTRDGVSTEVLGGDVEVLGSAAAGERVVAAVATPEALGELLLVEGGHTRALTSFGNAVPVVTPRELTITGRDGYPIHGWVAQPAGEGPFPVLLQIHGGPYAAYGIHLFDETQVLVDAGYAVVYCNPRGSAGYGSEHGRSIRGAMGTVDFADVIDFLDGATAQDARLDRERVGIMGGSYGGYLTAWVIAHDHRFAGAIVERGFLDPVSFQGTSDIGSFFGDEYVGTEADAIARQSPMAVVGEVRTPTLVLHSELDFRCPLEQATRYYSALKRQGTEAELLVFPGEDHELTRAGQPRHRVERFEAVLDWWRRKLPVTDRP
ncbi:MULTISPECIES: S9 family peptidase [unclassified Microbacterium]|uniref:S9 family peptidase n=1 Tax=unclassified Microbacterium TaxID=2609290 RepID=UPI00214A8BE3|nr:MULTISPECIES: S9 family peptidase [unclassified Microbacterium]MCR2809910.1 S9 family peptidase [Microbacterium sp. zg.B185]WIM17784.1 S9 family peptidase [Microbacterium sp. zg-B185]